jgi:hypothetical protein
MSKNRTSAKEQKKASTTTQKESLGNLAEVLVKNALCPSMDEAFEQINLGLVRVNKETSVDTGKLIFPGDLLSVGREGEAKNLVV